MLSPSGTCGAFFSSSCLGISGWPSSLKSPSGPILMGRRTLPLPFSCLRISLAVSSSSASRAPPGSLAVAMAVSWYPQEGRESRGNSDSGLILSDSPSRKGFIARGPRFYKRGLPSLAKGDGFRVDFRRGSGVRILPLAYIPGTREEIMISISGAMVRHGFL